MDLIPNSRNNSFEAFSWRNPAVAASGSISRPIAPNPITPKSNPMNPEFSFAMGLLYSQISESLPAHKPQSTELSELLLAGIGLRNGISMTQLLTLIPSLSVVRLRLGLTKALSDPSVSVWYFEQLDTFNDRFRNIIRERRPEHSRYPAMPTTIHKPVSLSRRPRIPEMPVTVSPWKRNR